MTEIFIPIEANDNDIWYMDVSNLSLSELISLKNQLLGGISYRALDKAIYDKSNITLDTYYNLTKREFQRNKMCIKSKKFTKSRRGC